MYVDNLTFPLKTNFNSLCTFSTARSQMITQFKGDILYTFPGPYLYSGVLLDYLEHDLQFKTPHLSYSGSLHSPLGQPLSETGRLSLMVPQAMKTNSSSSISLLILFLYSKWKLLKYIHTCLSWNPIQNMGPDINNIATQAMERTVVCGHVQLI